MHRRFRAVALHQLPVNLEEARIALALFLRRVVKLRGDLVPDAGGRFDGHDQLVQRRKPALPYHDGGGDRRLALGDFLELPALIGLKRADDVFADEEVGIVGDLHGAVQSLICSSPRSIQVRTVGDGASNSIASSARLQPSK
jgi:hypothetical protein